MNLHSFWFKTYTPLTSLFEQHFTSLTNQKVNIKNFKVKCLQILTLKIFVLNKWATFYHVIFEFNANHYLVKNKGNKNNQCCIRELTKMHLHNLPKRPNQVHKRVGISKSMRVPEILTWISIFNLQSCVMSSKSSLKI